MLPDGQSTRNFYDSFGWQKANEKTFNDSAIFVDGRPVLDFYKRRVFDRVSKELKREGKYFLDAGSGALPNLHRASGFERIICVDISIVGLVEAQKQLGARGSCVVADLAHLPFRDNIFDAILCSHALYHVPKEDQAQSSRSCIGRSTPESAAWLSTIERIRLWRHSQRTSTAMDSSRKPASWFCYSNIAYRHDEKQHAAATGRIVRISRRSPRPFHCITMGTTTSGSSRTLHPGRISRSNLGSPRAKPSREAWSQVGPSARGSFSSCYFSKRSALV